jgi:hypothetical protein
MELKMKNKFLSEKGQGLLEAIIATFFFVWVMLAIMAMSSNCAVTLWEAIRFWNNYCG